MITPTTNKSRKSQNKKKNKISNNENMFFNSLSATAVSFCEESTLHGVKFALKDKQAFESDVNRSQTYYFGRKHFYLNPVLETFTGNNRL